MNYESNIFEIANYFLHYQPMTHKKLQKLLYFCYGIYLATYNEDEHNLNDRLFENNFQAWVHGPVAPEIYSLYKNNGVNLLYIEEPYINTFSPKIQRVLNKTIEYYGNYEADELEEISHGQLPWKNARKNLGITDISVNPISDVDIFLAFRGIIRDNDRK